MKHLIALFVLATSILRAQTTAANLNNLPILLHPSLVGSSEGKRAAVAYGVGNSNIGKDRLGVLGLEEFQTNYLNLTYDQMWKKAGSGIGGYLNVSAIPSQSGAFHEYMEPYSKLRSGQWAAGASFAPKYLIMKKKAPEQIRFTWSPSLSINYNRHWANSSTEIPEDNKDYLAAYHGTSNYHHQTFDAQLGGLLNNKTLLLGATVGYSNYQSALTNTSNKYGTSSSSFNGNYLDYSAVVGVSFPRREKSLLGFSYTLKFTGARLLDNREFYKKNHLTAYGNMNIRVWKIVAGISSSNFNNSTYIGYKAKNWKATIGVRRENYPSSSYSFGETIFSYNF